MNNKKGVKLLAAIMAFAMVFVAGFAIIGASDDADADPVVPNAAATDISSNYQTVPETVPVTTDVSYKVTADTTISVAGKAGTTHTITLYVAEGKTVTINGATGSATTADISIIVKPANATCTKAFATDSYVTIAGMTNGSIKVTTAALGTNVSPAKASTMYVSGEITTGSITGLADSDVQVAPNLTLIEKDNSVTTVTTVTYGIAVTDNSADTQTYYGKKANITVAIDSADTVKVIDGSAIVSQGDNVVKLSTVTSTGGITVAGASSGNYPTLAGTAATGSISISGGLFMDSTLAATCTNVVKATTNGAGTFYMNQIPATPTLYGSTDATGFTIQGNITQRTNATMTSTIGITLTAGSSLVINEGVGVSSEAALGGLSTTGEVRVFGSLTVGSTTALTQTGTILIGPNGSVTGITNATVQYIGNTNVTSGNDYEIQGIPSSKDVGDSVLNGTLTIPKGTTFTVNGNLGLNGQKLIVEGTLVISKNAKVFGTGVSGKGVQIASTGSIQNSGMLGSMMSLTVSEKADSPVQKVTLTGVSGAEFSIKKIGGTDTLCVTGDIKKIRNAVSSTIVIDGAAISGEMTISKDVTLSGNTATTGAIVAPNAVLTINGKLTSTNNVAITLKEGAEVIINGILDEAKAINAEVGTYDSETNEFTAGAAAVFTATNNTTENMVNTPSGFTVYTKRVAVANDDGTVSYSRYAYINGQIVSSKADTNDEENEVLGISGSNVRIAEGESLVVKKNSSLTTTSASIIVEGALTFEAGSIVTSIGYVGAYYTVTPENTTDTATYYMPLPEAMKAIATADYMTVTANIDDIDFNITVKADQVLALTMTGSILDDATVEVEDDGTVSGTIPEVLGKLVVHPDADSSVPTSYASKKTASDGTVTYAGFAVAVGEAQPGDVIDIDSAQVGTSTKSKDLNIPEGVKVVIADRLTVYGDLNIPEGAELVGGLVFVNGTESDKAAVNVEGTFDVSAGSLGGEYNEVYSTGKAVFATKYSSMNGAYMTVSGNIVLTSVSNAVKYAIDNSISSVNVVGKVSDATDIDLKGKTLTIDSGSQVTLGNITLDGGKIVSNGDLTATITAPSGKVDTTGATVDSTLKLVKSTVTVESKKVTNASGVTTYTFSFNAIDGEMTVVDGVVTIKDDISTATAKSKLTVATGAELQVIAGKTTIDGDNVQFVTDGTLTVKDEGEVEFAVIENTGKAPVVNGTIAVEDGKVVVKTMKLLGTITISDTETVKGTFQVSDSAFTIGAPIESIGAAASITGPVKVDDGEYIKAYAGADLSKAVINVPTGGETTIKTTDFYVNDVPYATVYAEGTVTVASVISATEVSDIEGVVDVTSIIWKNADGTTSTATNIGDADALYLTMTLSTANVTVSVGTGISVYIDGVKYTSGTTAKLTIGTHDVSATVNPGYKGTVNVTFNGQTISNGKIDVTADMLKQTSVVLSATGEISIDNGSSSGSSSSNSDDGMGITDYLLIVLVVLAAILVVIVALRMMRS